MNKIWFFKRQILDSPRSNVVNWSYTCTSYTEASLKSDLSVYYAISKKLINSRNGSHAKRVYSHWIFIQHRGNKGVVYRQKYRGKWRTFWIWCLKSSFIKLSKLALIEMIRKLKKKNRNKNFQIKTGIQLGWK